MFKTPNFQKAKTPSNLKVSNIKAAPQDLKERFNQFFERVIKLCKKCPINATTSRIISQLIGCGGSIPANYAEASEAMSKKDFEFLLKGKKDLAEMEALKQLGLSKIRINKIKDGVIGIVVGSAFKTFL